MKVLITGSSSEIGSSLVKKLCSDGHDVVAFDIQLPGKGIANCKLVQGDIRDVDAVYRAAKGCDAGIHLAVRANDSTEEEILSVNILGAYSFFKAAEKNNFQVSVLVSSAPVHLAANEIGNDLLLDTADGDTYDLSKKLQEVIAQDFQSHGLPMICLRLGHVVRGETETCLESGAPLTALEYCRGGWVALEDVVAGCRAALETAGDRSFAVYNLVGARSSRDRFDVAAAERRLAISLKYDFHAYEKGADT